VKEAASRDEEEDQQDQPLNQMLDNKFRNRLTAEDSAPGTVICTAEA